MPDIILRYSCGATTYDRIFFRARAPKAEHLGMATASPTDGPLARTLPCLRSHSHTAKTDSFFVEVSESGCRSVCHNLCWRTSFFQHLMRSHSGNPFVSSLTQSVLGPRSISAWMLAIATACSYKSTVQRPLQASLQGRSQLPTVFLPTPSSFYCSSPNKSQCVSK